jgi:hypothetical protein
MLDRFFDNDMMRFGLNDERGFYTTLMRTRRRLHRFASDAGLRREAAGRAE